jgi:aspartate-semialdehyde dehydrogenase
MTFLLNKNTNCIQTAILGATGLLGQELIKAMVDSEIPFSIPTLWASGQPSKSSIEIETKEGVREISVRPLIDDWVKEIQDVDLVICALPMHIAAEAITKMVDVDLLVVDLSGVKSNVTPLQVSGLAEYPDRFIEDQVLSLPSAPVLMLSRLLEALSSLDWMGVRAEVYLSAAAFGQKGVQELSQQVGALFNMSEPQRDVFPSGLAFDMIPSTSELGWSMLEQKAARELGQIFHFPQTQFVVGMSVMPLFTGMAASIQVITSEQVKLEDVQTLLDNSEYLQYAHPIPGPRRLTGISKIFCGRFRPDPMGDGFYLWCSADNLYAGSIVNTLEVLTHFWKDGRF